MNFIIKFRFSSFSAKYLFAIWIVFVFHSCFLLETDLGKNLQHRMTASCSVNPAGCGVSTQVIANIVQTLTPDIELQENGVTYASNSSIDFGGILQGTSSTKTISIQNLGTANLTLTSSPVITITGTDAAMFVITQPSSTTIPVGANIQFTVTFTPTSTGTKTASISITNDDFDESNYIINLTGSSSTQLSPEINIVENSVSYASNSSFNFAVVTLGNSNQRNFIIQNLGTAPLNLTGTPIVSISGTDSAMFTITQPTATNIANGANTTFAVTFNPTSIGTKTASITITNNDSDESSYVINLLGTSNAPLTPEINVQENNVNYASNSSFDFGGIVQGNSTLRTFTVQNLGTAALNLTGNPIVNVTGTDAAMFNITQPTANSIAAGANILFVVTFNPTSTGTKTATISITNNDSDESSYVINLTGTSNAPVPAPEIDIQENNVSYAVNSTYNFGSVTESTESKRTFKISNLGTSILNLTGSPVIAISGTDIGMFSITQPNVTSLNAGESIEFTVSFVPNSLGSKTATIQIANDDSNESTYVINLTGTGSAPAPEIDVRENGVSYASGSTYNFGDVGIGGQGGVTKTFTIDNTGSVMLHLAGLSGNKVELSGVDASNFIISQELVFSEVSPQTSVSFTVTFSPETEGTKVAKIVITSDDSDEGTYSIFLQGNATLVTSAKMSIETPDKTKHVNGASYDFNTVVADGSKFKTETFFIANLGNAELTLSGTPIVLIAGANANLFTVTEQPASSSIPQLSQPLSFTLEFKPTAGFFSTAQAEIIIVNNDPNQTNYKLIIKGTGTMP